MGERPWFTEAFDELYLELYAHRDQAEADRAVRWLADVESLAGRRVVDLGCGSGRHLRSLAAAGAWPIGVELSPALVRIASESARCVATGSVRPTPTVEVLRGDLRHLPLAAAGCDGVLSMFTSLGYFATAVENRGVLEEAARVVSPAGFALIDYLNAPLVRRQLPADSERRVGSYRVRERRRLAETGQRVIKEIEVDDAVTERPVRRYHESVALWDREELTAMLQAAGWNVERASGDYDGRPFVEHTSSRLLLLCRRSRTP